MASEVMAPPNSMNGGQSTERTPLLPSNSQQSGNGSAINGSPSLESIGEAALGVPDLPVLGKTRSYSHSHWLAPDEDPNVIPEPETPPQFREDGLLEGISKTKFRLIYGGILLGYFVRIYLHSWNSTGST